MKLKFRNLIFLFIIGAILVAWFTKPGLDDFNKFYHPHLSADGTPPVVDVSDKFLYSTATVNYYSPVNIRLNNSNGKVAVPVRKESYIGLFGRFWKK